MRGGKRSKNDITLLKKLVKNSPLPRKKEMAEAAEAGICAFWTSAPLGLGPSLSISGTLKKQHNFFIKFKAKSSKTRDSK